MNAINWNRTTQYLSDIWWSLWCWQYWKLGQLRPPGDAWIGTELGWEDLVPTKQQAAIHPKKFWIVQKSEIIWGLEQYYSQHANGPKMLAIAQFGWQPISLMLISKFNWKSLEEEDRDWILSVQKCNTLRTWRILKWIHHQVSQVCNMLREFWSRHARTYRDIQTPPE